MAAKKQERNGNITRKMTETRVLCSENSVNVMRKVFVLIGNKEQTSSPATVEPPHIPVEILLSNCREVSENIGTKKVSITCSCLGQKHKNILS